jgi:signal recognition particle subunit SEC65
LENTDFCPVVKKPSLSTVSDIIEDIGIKPVGCFTNIKDLIFESCVNPYSTKKVMDSGIRIINYPEDIVNLINKVIQNGYDLYGNKIKNTYKGTDYSNLNIKELATLGYLSGYRYMSIYKNDLNEKKNIFYSYGPPQSDKDTVMNSDLPNYTLTPKLNNYKNEDENAPGKELSCGYPCFKDKNPEILIENGIQKQYMCGSITFPTIKTPPRYAVYEIYEKK